MQLTILFFLVATFASAHSLTCLGCDQITCTPPKNCAGSLALDACACCHVCAKQEGEACGGLFNTAGTCDKGLACLLPEPTSVFPGTRTMMPDPLNVDGICMKHYSSCFEACQQLPGKGKPIGTAMKGFSTVLKVGKKGFHAYCDCTDRTQPWTIMQRRMHDTEDFDKDWRQYKSNFGFSNSDYWIGLDNLHSMTKSQNYEMMITIKYEDTSYDTESHYSTFSVGDEKSGFQLFIGGNIGRHSSEFVTNHNGMKFSTKDVDNDKWLRGNCAKWYSAGWWFNSCTRQNLNGVMYGMGPLLPANPKMVFEHPPAGPDRISWKDCDPKQIKMVEMKIRPGVNYYYS